MSCPGIEVAPGHFSGCTAAQTGAKDCPACGPRLTCPGCGETVLEVESSERGWRSTTACGDLEVICPECQKGDVSEREATLGLLIRGRSATLGGCTTR